MFPMDNLDKIALTDSSAAIFDYYRPNGEHIRLLIDAEDTKKLMGYGLYWHEGDVCCTRFGKPYPVSWVLLDKPREGYEWRYENQDKRDNRKQNLKLICTSITSGT